MNIITSINELRTVAKNNFRDIVILQLNKEIVDFLYSIKGKNRDISATNLQTWVDCIRRGEWSLDNAEMKVNNSLTWLIEGHHRINAIISERAYGLNCIMHIVPDDLAEQTFKNQDCRGLKRKVSVQCTLAGIQDSAVWCAIDLAYRSYLFGDATPSTVDSVERFLKDRENLIDKVDLRRKLFGEDRSAPCLAVACIIRACEMFPEKIDLINAFWRRVVNGEMLNRRMPEYHLRMKYLHPDGISRKDMVWYTLKALSFSLDGVDMGVLKIASNDNKTLAVKFGITSPKNSNKASTSTEMKKLAAKENTKLSN